MKIESRKITSNPRKFSFILESEKYKIIVEGELFKLKNGLIKIDSQINGEMEFICDLSGESFKKDIKEKLILFAKDGIWDGHKDDNYFDVIEFFDGYVDLKDIFRCELESIQLDYHIKEGV